MNWCSSGRQILPLLLPLLSLMHHPFLYAMSLAGSQAAAHGDRTSLSRPQTPPVCMHLLSGSYLMCRMLSVLGEACKSVALPHLLISVPAAV